MLLADVPTVRAILGADDIDDVNRLLEHMLKSATVNLGNMLRTAFDEVSGQTDTFFIDRTRIVGTPSKVTLQLRQGLASGVSSVRVAGDLRTLRDGQGADITPQVFADKPKGVISVHRRPHDHQFYEHPWNIFDLHDVLPGEVYVQVTYDAGLKADTATPPVYQDVPMWLEEAAINFVMWKLRAQNHWLAKNVSSDEASADTSTLRMHIQDLINPHIRYQPDAFPALEG